MNLVDHGAGLLYIYMIIGMVLGLAGVIDISNDKDNGLGLNGGQGRFDGRFRQEMAVLMLFCSIMWLPAMMWTVVMKWNDDD